MKYWREDIEKARSEAQKEHKLLVLEYDGAVDADLVSAMTPEEFAEAKAGYDKRSVYGGWITVSEDYTEKVETVREHILAGLLNGAKERMKKLAEFNAPFVMLEGQRKIIDKLEAGKLNISGDKDALDDIFHSAEPKKGRGGKVYYVINGCINYFPAAQYGPYIKRA